jgi:hypothetical protein
MGLKMPSNCFGRSCTSHRGSAPCGRTRAGMPCPFLPSAFAGEGLG